MSYVFKLRGRRAHAVARARLQPPAVQPPLGELCINVVHRHGLSLSQRRPFAYAAIKRGRTSLIGGRFVMPSNGQCVVGTPVLALMRAIVRHPRDYRLEIWGAGSHGSPTVSGRF